jgi:hypothetical protein
MLMIALGSRHQDYFFSKGETARKGQRNFSANGPTSLPCRSRKGKATVLIMRRELHYRICSSLVLQFPTAF